MTILSVENLVYKHILKDINLSFTEPKIIGIIGPNGAGKSTLLRLLAGFYKPTSGDICVRNTSLRTLSDKARAKEIAYMPQEFPENVYFSVEEYVKVGRFSARDSTKDAEVVSGALQMLHLTSMEQEPVRTLSGGERQRVAIARCIAQESKILLLDEPISNLDIHYQLEILHFIRSFGHAGHLVLISLHHLEFAAEFCDEIVVMQEGKVYSRGLPMDVVNEQMIRDVFQVSANRYHDPFQNHIRLSYEFTPGDV